MNLRAAWICFSLAGLLILSGAAGAVADDPKLTAEEQQAIDSARKALTDGHNPWYDSQTDSLQAMELEAPERSTNLGDWSWLLSALSDILVGLVYVLLGLAVAAIVGLLIWFALKIKRGDKVVRKRQDDAVEVLDQVEALPFMAERSRDDLLGQARRHYEQGNYSEAIIYLFSYELVELDKFSRIHLAKGKTNRQYLRELAGAAPPRAPLERTLLAFESVFFGRRTLDRGAFEACWNELPQFEAQLRGATG
jgi:hypothetical protein